MNTTEKIKKLLTVMDCEECFAVPGRSIIDVIHPETGQSWYYGKTLEQIRAETGNADAVRMTVDAFCADKAERQRTPVEWTPTTQAEYDEMLCCLPPEAVAGHGFLVGEPYDHDAGNGRPRFQAFRHAGGLFERSNRPITVEEFRRLLSPDVVS